MPVHCFALSFVELVGINAFVLRVLAYRRLRDIKWAGGRHFAISITKTMDMH